MPRTKNIATKPAKQVAKPVTAVTGISKSQAEKFLAKVPEENVFWCNDGRLLRDIKDLKEALATMSDQTFAYHSNNIKKDFSNWVRDIVGDYNLARDLEMVSNREEAARIAEARYLFLASKLA